ncbi:DUF7059 domain-containing protein [Brachybacterium sp. AOP25-B2-12]|uniref:DUF7059 domain-containing protein n=1 Tax=Brachybacterium sp. AOP25-B2-12 TaxID=3457710 RepID=UPI0040347E17
MPTPATPTPPAVGAPVTDGAAIAALRADLLAARYDDDHLRALLGPVAADALGREDAAPARRALRDVTDPCAVLFSLFTLGARPDRAMVEAALPRLGVDTAVRLGLLTADTDDPATVRARVDLTPYAAQDDLGEIRWWIASDPSELATGATLPADHVLGVGGASRTLLRITPRTPVDRALDLGCGCGIQALHAARHARAVVATDISPRALAFADFNAALNGIELDLREGSFFAPVAGETFGLIVSNPPFVITPREAGLDAWTYRDGGAAGDAITERVLREIPAHLSPGGTAAMLGNWEIPTGRPWDTRPGGWVRDLAPGIDAWIIQRDREDPAQYAETWARDGGVTERDPRWPGMIDAWLDDFAARDAEGIGFGYVLVRRHREARDDARLLEEVTTTGSGALGAHLDRGLTVLGALADLDDDALGVRRPVRAEDVVERRHLTPGAWDPMLIELVQGAGLGRSVHADQLLAATVGAADGELGLSQILGAVCALTGEDPAEATPRVLAAVRELVRFGMLDLDDARDAPGGPVPPDGRVPPDGHARPGGPGPDEARA